MKFEFLAAPHARYLIAGAFNTAFGYGFTVLCLSALEGSAHTFVVAFLANMINLSVAFLVHKLFVFKSRGNWLAEWGKSFLVYGVSGVFAATILWLLIDVFTIAIYFAQALTMVLVVGFSFFAHARFTFGKGVVRE
jgi:putative flippase GtrA